MSAQDDYQSILSRLSAMPVHPYFRPVHLFLGDDTWMGSGTLSLNPLRQHSVVVTASHIFSVSRLPDFMYYRVLQPYSAERFPLASAIGGVGDASQPSFETDIAVCTPGPPARVGCFSNHLGGRWPTGKRFAAYPQREGAAVSVVTGEEVPVLGFLRPERGPTYYVLQYQSCPGESGTGFVKSEHELFVLSSGIDVTSKLRTAFGIPKRFSLVTLASAIKFGW